MTIERYSRWQGLAIAQLSVAIALISALSIAGLGAGLSLLQSKEFMQALPHKRVFATAMFLLMFAATFSCSAVIARALDFRLTARKVRKDRNPDYTRSASFLCLDAAAFGRMSWGLFWLSCIALLVGAIALVVSIVSTYAKWLA